MVSKQERQSVAERFAAQIIKELREGTAPWQKPWKAGEYHRPMNPVTGTVYKGINAVMLSRGYADPRWMTMRQANEQGWRVKKGSRAQQVIFWQWDEKQKVLDAEGKPELDASGKEKTETVKLDRPRLHVYSVFHASQLMTLDGQDIPAFEPQPLGWAPEEKGEVILAASGASITHDQRDQAFYKPSADEIHLPPQENFPDGGAYYSTALHELGHWSGHPSRLNREFGPRGSEQYAREELRAEISSWMLNQDVGLPHLPQQHLSYVDSWVTVLQKDPYEIMRACRDAEQIKDYVMAMEQKQEQVTEQPLTSVEAEINRTMADASRWDDLGAAREANKYAVATLQDLADGNMPLAMERLGLAAEVEAENAADVGPTFAGCQAQLAALLSVNTEWAKEKMEVLEETAPASLEERTVAAVPKIAQKKIFLNVPYKEKAAAKAAGAKWDREEKRWYAPEGTALAPVQAWLPSREPLPPLVAVSPVDEFAQRLQAAGLILAAPPIMDGEVHRVPVEGGKPGAKDGAYCGHLDGRPVGIGTSKPANQL